MKIKAVILDLDDTLFMTERVCFDLENEVAGRLGFGPMTREAHQKNWGKTMASAIPERFPGIDYEQFIAIFPGVMRQYVKEGHLDQLSAANINALRQLQDQGIHLLAVTSRKLFEVEHLFDPGHDLSQYMGPQQVFHQDNNPFTKPDPRAFDAALRFLELPAEECVYVGDSFTDCQAAKGAGMQFVACLESGLRQRSDFETLTPPPDGYIDNFADITEWLSQKTTESAKI